MKPWEHQIAIADEAYNVLSKYGIVYLAMLERTGKTLTSILLAEKTTRTKVLVLTKKKALGGWNETIEAYEGDGRTAFTVLNYHAVHTRYKTKAGKTAYKLNIKPTDYDLIILDESHSYLSAYPKTGAIWRSVKKLCSGLPIIYLSATSNAQGYQLLFNQFSLSDWSPFREYKTFYDWFGRDEDRANPNARVTYGVPDKIRTSYGLQETYKKCKPEVWDKVKHLFITYTRKELGFKHEPEDELHYFELAEDTRRLYNECLKTELLITPQFESPLDSSMKLRTTLHMLEGGVAKVDDEYYVLPNAEKARAIMNDFGDSKDMFIMYQYKAEFLKLRDIFRKATLLQATSYAEGVDLSMFEHGIIYSQDFSTARHAQRRARQANMNRETPIKMHFYLLAKGISEQVYKTVSLNKENFVDSMFERELL